MLLESRIDVELAQVTGLRFDLREAYQAARDVTRAGSKTFYFSSHFLAPAKRRAIWAVYAFCRTTDDIVDRDAPAAERLAALERVQRKTIAAFSDQADDPLFAALADAVKNFEIPLEPALDLLRGARMDITIRRYQTFEALREYCYLVASTVGLLVSPVLGVESREALPYGVTLGRAMQLTNILRDVGEDARMGRIYLPLEDLARFGYSESNVFEAVIDDAFVALMKFEIERVRALYREAEPGIALLSPDSQYTVRLALKLYSGILGAIERSGYDVFSRRAFVPMRSKIMSAMSLALARP